jgi:hypothetical protein
MCLLYVKLDIVIISVKLQLKYLCKKWNELEGRNLFRTGLHNIALLLKLFN